MTDASKVKNLTVDEVKAGMEAGTMLVVDVREPNETTAEHIPGTVFMPLQSFDPSQLPDPGDKQLVFSCRSGKRSVTASLLAQQAGLPYDAHMAGGILAWKEKGFDTETG